VRTYLPKGIGEKANFMKVEEKRENDLENSENFKGIRLPKNIS
jgi:hypothetical protein